MPRVHPPRRRGNVIPIVAILAVFLVGMVAFAIDTGYVAGTRTQLQAATDAGALAGCEKLGTWAGGTLPEASAKAECKKFAQANETLTIRDADIRILRYNPAALAGSRISTTYSTASPPNCVEVTMRRDELANGKLPLLFAPVLGQKNADVRARSWAYMMPAAGVKPGAPLLPYCVQIDYYFAACGQTRIGVDGKVIATMDGWTVSPTGAVVAGADGVRRSSCSRTRTTSRATSGLWTSGAGRTGRTS